MFCTTRAAFIIGSLLVSMAAQVEGQARSRVRAVSDTGRGAETWVLLSGIIGGIAGFRRLEERLLMTGARVIVIDPFHLSIDSADVTFVAMARRVERILAQKGITQARVVGHERGAGVALRLAAADPHRVKALYFLDAGALSTNGSAILSASLRLVPLIARVPGGQGFIRARIVSGLRDNAGTDRWLDAETQIAYTEPIIDDIDRVIAMAFRLGRSHEIEPVSAIVPRVRVPVLVLLGSVPHASGARAPELNALAPFGSRHRVIRLAGVGHFPHQEAPDLVAALMTGEPLRRADIARSWP